MNAAVPSPLRPLVRWAARVTSLLLFWLVGAIAVGEGIPNVLDQPTRVQVEFAALGVLLLGLAVGWLRAGIGGLLVLLGWAAFNAVELAVHGRPAVGTFLLFAVPGVLFLLSAILERGGRQQPVVP